MQRRSGGNISQSFKQPIGGTSERRRRKKRDRPSSGWRRRCRGTAAGSSRSGRDSPLARAIRERMNRRARGDIKKETSDDGREQDLHFEGRLVALRQKSEDRRVELEPF